MGDAIKVEIQDRVALITMNRPEALNAMSPEWITDFFPVLDEIENRDDVGIAILTGAGRAFCAGGDLNHPIFNIDGIEARRPFVARGYSINSRIRRLPIPFIAAINGPAVGAGVTMAAVCDLRIAAESAYFRLDFVKVGVLPDMGCCFFLPNLIGSSKAMQMAMLADQVDAAEALRIGLVNRVVPDDQIMDAAHEMAQRLLNFPPLALRYIKRAIYELPSKSFQDAMDTESEYINYLIGTYDCREGVNAFLEKRPPEYKGE
ncbi:enoyl-CoA hydratase/isomerase family protein [Thermodesulfobacteriota bacterium]